jgi:LysR family transcriptional regulator (chromosome initiation inhibitor)
MMLMSQNMQAFFAVTRTGTVGGAAANLGLTQTAVSHRIKSIEREVGASLFIRNRNGMTLTQEGEAILQYCLQAEELEGRVMAKIVGSGILSPVNITIAGPTSLISSRIVKQTQTLHAKWPHLRLSFRIDDNETRLSLLKTGRVHFVIVRPQYVVAELDSKMLQPEKFLLVGHPSWKGRKLNDILADETIIDFHEDDPTTEKYLSEFELLHFSTGARIFANENRALIELFCAGVGFGTLSREIAEPYISNGRLIALNSGKSMNDPAALAWFPRKEMPEYFKEIITAIK